MFGSIGVICAVLEMARHEQQTFEASLVGLDPAEAQRRRERREDQANAERRHREMVAAIGRKRGLFW